MNFPSLTSQLNGVKAMPMPRYVSEASDLERELENPSPELAVYQRGMAICGMNRESERWFRRVWTRPELKPDSSLLKALSIMAQSELKELQNSSELTSEEKEHFDDMLSNVAMRIEILKAMEKGDLSWEHKKLVNKLVEEYIQSGQRMLAGHPG